MKRKIILILLTLVIFISFSYAHPPSDVEMSYSHKNEELLIKYIHVTNDRDDHYIRRIEVMKAEGEPEKFYFVRQKHTRDIEQVISTKLNANENITVKIFCEKGGVSQESFAVPEVEEQDKKKTNTGG